MRVQAGSPGAGIVLRVTGALLLGFIAATSAYAEEHPDLTGEKLTNELCLGCHETIAGEISANEHAAVEEGCTSCHDVLKAKEAPYLSGSLKEVCGTCHELTDKEIVQKHGSQPFASVACTGCHNPHGSKNKALLPPYVHAPFGEGQCDACHDAPQGDKIKLAAESAQALCDACHEDLQKKFSGAKVVHAVIESEGCPLCHSPHASPYPAHLLEPEAKLCLGCHDDVGAKMAMKYSHPPTKDPGCRACHEPHASNFPARLRTDTNPLCLGCHQTGLPRGATLPQAVETAPGFSVPATYLQGVNQLNLDQRGVGHPIFNHPVAGRPDPLNKDSQLSCLSCHVPHGGDSVKLIAFPVPPGQGICQKCHQM